MAPASTTAREVQKVASEYLAPLNHGLQSIGSATNFAHYVENTYRAVVMPIMAKSTQERSNGIIKNYLMPAFASRCLRDLTAISLQAYFTGMADSLLSHESKDKIRDVLSSILGSALKFGLLVKNPMENVQMPPEKRGKKRRMPYVTPQQFEVLVDLIAEPYATMIYVAVYTGLRVSEIIGLRWDDVLPEHIVIDERCFRGDWSAPKSASNATLPVNPSVIQRIERLKTLTVDVGAGTATRR